MKASRGNARGHCGILHSRERIYQLNCESMSWKSVLLESPNNDNTSTPLHHDYSVDFETQIDQYEKYGDRHLPQKRKNALVAIWIGYELLSLKLQKYANGMALESTTSQTRPSML